MSPKQKGAAVSTMSKVGKSTQFLNQSDSQARNQKNLDNFITNRSYKKIPSHKQYCICSICTLVGNELIKIQYTEANNILIEDNNPSIFQLFGKELVK